MDQFIKEWMNVMIFVPIATVWAYMFKKNIDSYTKKETEEQITLRTAPMKELLDRNTTAIESLQASTALAHKEMHKTLVGINTELTTMRALREERKRRHNDENPKL